MRINSLMEKFYLIKRRGLVGDNFTDPKIIEQLKGHTAIGLTDTQLLELH